MVMSEHGASGPGAALCVQLPFLSLPSKLLRVRTTGRTDVEMKCLAEIFF